METRVYNVFDNCINAPYIKECAEILKNGGTVAFPTETVYGLGADAFNVSAVEKIYVAKNRPPVKPLSVCVSDIAMAESVAVFNDNAKLLFNLYLPGPLTIVLPKKSCVPDIVTAGLNTVGIRVPSNTIARELVSLSGVPLALPSANLSGQGALTNGADVVEALNGRVDAIINAGETAVGAESTIISLVDKPEVLRVGAIPSEELLARLR